MENKKRILALLLAGREAKVDPKSFRCTWVGSAVADPSLTNAVVSSLFRAGLVVSVDNRLRLSEAGRVVAKDYKKVGEL